MNDHILETVYPEEMQIEEFKKIPSLFGENPGEIFFLRITSLNIVKGLESGDVLIVDKSLAANSKKLGVYFDRIYQKFIVSRKDISDSNILYWGSVRWILKYPFL
jgi:hypothetical protein